MSISDAFESDLLKLIFNGTAIANIADNAVTAPLTSLFIALHTADPGEAGTQATSETIYTGYARVAVARTTGGWGVTGTNPTQAAPVANITFGAWTAGVGTLTHWSIGVAASGATKILLSGTITPSIVLGAGVVPALSTSTNVTLD